MPRQSLAMLALLFAPTAMLNAGDYSATKTVIDGVQVVQLEDARHSTEVRIAVSIGNNAYTMKVNGKNALWFPYQTLAEWKAEPRLCGNPFMAPWANRLDQDAFFANGKKYSLNDALGNLRRDPNKQPIHGLLLFSDRWKVVALEADEQSARVTSRLEFWKYPDLMGQFPFAHAIEMTYRLSGGRLEVETVLRNLSQEPMPVSVGYHPYFRIHDVPRDQAKVRIAARQQVVLSRLLTPTGETKPSTLPEEVSLSEVTLDDVFTDLIRGTDGSAEFRLQGRNESVSVIFGPKYRVAVIYAPPKQDFVAIEPMAALTNALNLAHAGLYADLQSIPPGGEWRESFWIVPGGF